MQPGGREPGMQVIDLPGVVISWELAAAQKAVQGPRGDSVTREEEAGWEAVQFQKAPQMPCCSHPAATESSLGTLAKDVMCGKSMTVLQQ